MHLLTASRIISAEMVGVQGPPRPRWGLKGSNAPFKKTNFAHFEAKTWPLLERKVLNYQITVKFDKRNALITFKLTVARGNNVVLISHFQLRRSRKNADKETGS